MPNSSNTHQDRGKNEVETCYILSLAGFVDFWLICRKLLVDCQIALASSEAFQFEIED